MHGCKELHKIFRSKFLQFLKGMPKTANFCVIPYSYAFVVPYNHPPVQGIPSNRTAYFSRSFLLDGIRKFACLNGNRKKIPLFPIRRISGILLDYYT